MKYLKELDAYGIQFNLRFREYKGSYKTYLGAFVTLIISILILGTVGHNFDRMINMKNPNVAMYTDSLNTSTFFKGYDYKKLNYIPFIGIESAQLGVEVNLTEFFEHFELIFYKKGTN